MLTIQSGYIDAVHPSDGTLVANLSAAMLFLMRKSIRNYRDGIRILDVSSSWCHLAARVVATVYSDYDLTVCDGRVYDLGNFKISGDNYQCPVVNTIHSWCLTRHGSILDVAPVGVQAFMPILYARRETRWGFVSNRFEQTEDVRAGVDALLASPQYARNFAPYVDLLTEARQAAQKEWSWLE